ncbi:MAG: hypothetical protein IE932_00135 [Sphingopyxis terrae]|nr:hypothetical protein [Sphingopyxis terrae]
MWVKFDRNALFPGYRDDDGNCVPFTPLTNLPRANYVGDYYVDEFTDAKIRGRWAVCKADPACADKVRSKAREYMEEDARLTGSVDPDGKIDPEGEVDLRAVRRPAYFGRAPLGEAIARADKFTTIVEFTLPPDPYERIVLGRTKAVKVRGWYLVGKGVVDDKGRRRRALIVMNNGGGFEITARDDPRADGVVRDPSGNYHPAQGPVASTEQAGQRYWRGFVAALWDAGFDVLATVRRGNGVSGGASSHNAAEQGRDMFRQLEQMESGDGLRILTPEGVDLAGNQVHNLLMGGMKAKEIPVFFAGYSRGSYATAWAMQQNFVTDCELDSDVPKCARPRNWPNVRGAILYGSNSGGLGYRFAPHGDLVEAALRDEFHTVYYPDGDVLKNIGSWPAVAIIRGTWDGVEALDGSLDALARARQPKLFWAFRGPHLLNTQSPENMRLAGAQMVRFATGVILGRLDSERANPSRRNVVRGAPPYWEKTNSPLAGKR